MGKEITEIGKNGQSFKIILQAKYLGTTIGDTGDGINEEIKVRINKASKIMGALTTVWKQQKISLEKKIQLYCSLVRPVLCYAMEVRELSMAQMVRYESTQIRHLRRILRSPSHITKENNTTVREKTNMPSIDSYLQAAKIAFWKKQEDQRNEAVWTANWGKLITAGTHPNSPPGLKEEVQNVKKIC